jgi:large subunit ribosomal protein L23
MAVDGKHYEVVRRPVLTEKTNQHLMVNTYCFEIAPHANKLEVKAAVEAIWGVKVHDVRTVTTHGEERRNRVGRFETKGGRKAYVRLKQGYEIEIV